MAEGLSGGLGLPVYYMCGVIVILASAFVPLLHATQMLRQNHRRLPAVIRSYAMLLGWDWYLVITYLARDGFNMAMGGPLRDDAWCRAQGFLNIAGILALRMAAAINAYAIYRTAQGRPLPEQRLFKAHAAAWACGTALAALFGYAGSYGPYKQLYCCLKEDAYEPYATGPCFLVTFSSIVAVLYFNWKAHEQLKVHTEVATPEVELLVKRGLVHGLSFYVLWSFVIGAGTVTALGGHVPVLVDMVAAWLVKVEAAVDAYLLMDTMEMLMHPGKQPVWIKLSSLT